MSDAMTQELVSSLQAAYKEYLMRKKVYEEAHEAELSAKHAMNEAQNAVNELVRRVSDDGGPLFRQAEAEAGGPHNS